MAYISQDQKKTLSVGIKEVLKKYGMKGTISVSNHSSLVVTIKSGKLDIIKNWFDKATESSMFNRYNEKIIKPESIQVNEYWIDQNYTGEVKDFLIELLNSMKGDKWYDDSDVQSDYFNIAWYTHIYVGSWDKPYQVV
jgi:ABC-type proline/glycine betaine transport system substrate-binding protein